MKFKKLLTISLFSLLSISMISCNQNENIPVEPDKPLPDDNKDPEKPNQDIILPAINHIRFLAKGYTHCYTWNNGGSDKYFGEWPGKLMNKLDETWYYIDLPEGITSSSVIFNNGSNQDQTQDLHVNGVGYHWYDRDKNKFSHSDKYGGDFDSTNPTPGPNLPDPEPEKPFEPVVAESYKEFKLWDEMKKNPEKYKIINKYSGNRHDFRDETIYFAMTTRFYDGDSENNVYCWDGKHVKDDPEWRGDFKGLIKRLDYIKALGFTSIWITPIVENASGFDYHGYHALNMDKVDPRYESEDCNFQDLINAVHAKDMKIILDVVLNHTGNFGERNIFPMFEKNGDPNSVESMKEIGRASCRERV